MFSSLWFNPYCTTENVLTEADWGKPDRRTLSLSFEVPTLSCEHNVSLELVQFSVKA